MKGCGMEGGCFTDAMLHSSITCHQEYTSRATQRQPRCLWRYNFTFQWFFQSVGAINLMHRQHKAGIRW
jgi:hypothetical protein